jgi:hypothetical protein
MCDLHETVRAELSNIAATLNQLPTARPCSRLSSLELAGVAAVLHSFYNGVEKVLKQVLRSRQLSVPQGSASHRDLVELALRLGVLSDHTLNALAPFLAFRHFFRHSYALDLSAEQMEPLVHDARKVYELFARDMNALVGPTAGPGSTRPADCGD